MTSPSREACLVRQRHQDDLNGAGERAEGRDQTAARNISKDQEPVLGDPCVFLEDAGHHRGKADVTTKPLLPKENTRRQGTQAGTLSSVGPQAWRLWGKQGACTGCSAGAIFSSPFAGLWPRVGGN